MSRALRWRSAALALIARTGRSASWRKPASTSPREDPHRPPAWTQSAPSARADETSPNAAQRDSTDSEEDTVIGNDDSTTRLRVPPCDSQRQTNQTSWPAARCPGGGRAAPCSPIPLGQVEAEVLELDREIHVLEADILAHTDPPGSEVQHGLDPGHRELFDHALRRLGRHRDDRQ